MATGVDCFKLRVGRGRPSQAGGRARAQATASPLVVGGRLAYYNRARGEMYRGSCRARAWSESACGMFLLGWVPWPSWERTPVLHCSGWANRNNQKDEKDVKALMGASPIVAYRVR
ncbi:hypothetical protein [Oryza sativa Japonica Group]|uniref:Uncharacterized protein n=3 Tax=Oryza sativa TaxID=4530 RepID=Q5JNL1_ORYSJ|nr:hypothetical protein [Oryza sativa Japonica Group]